VVMVNGKPRDKVEVAADISEDEAKKLALATEAIQRAVNGSSIKNVIFIARRKGQEPKVNIVI